MYIIEVKSKKDWRLFHQTLQAIYKNDQSFIYPLERDIEKTFNPATNKVFINGEAVCYVLLDEQKKPVGRIAAFIDHERNKNRVVTEGGIGFFECADNETYAAKLFETAEQYLKGKKAMVIDGPINFGERDRYWGLLKKGFSPPLYQENYNPTYYEKLFLQQNYIPFEQILTYKGATKDIPFARLSAIAERLKSRQPVEVKPLDFNHPEEFAHGFVEVYNASFKKFAHFKPIHKDQILHFLSQAKSIADTRLACIAYYNGNPAGFVALYPDINRFLKHARGKLNWFTIPLFLIKNTMAKEKIAKGMGFGIHPDYQSKGIFSFLINFMGKDGYNVKKYPYMCLAGIRAHNNAIVSMYSKLNVKLDRIHVAYRKALDPDVQIEPFEFLEEGAI